MQRPSRRLPAAVATAVAAAGALTLPSASATTVAPTHLVINEVYGGGGNSGAVFTHDFVELYNPTAEPISLSGMSLQYRAAGGNTAPGSSNVFALPAAQVAPGGHFLVQLAAGNGTSMPALPTPDAASATGMGLAGGGGQIFLSSSTEAVNPGEGAIAHPSVVDFVGWGGSTKSFEGSGPAPGTANGTSVSRRVVDGIVVDTDDNATDFAAATAPSPTAADRVAQPLSLELKTLNANVGLPFGPVAIEPAGGKAPYTISTSALPDGIVFDAATGELSGTPTVDGDVTVTVTVKDSAETPADVTADFTFRVFPAADVKTIAEVQGDGARSPLAPATGNNTGSQVIAVEGVITADYATGGFNGFFLQTAGTGGTTKSEDASDAIFVYSRDFADADVTIGDSVRVTGRVAEYYDHTQISALAGGVVELDAPLAPVTPFQATWPETDAEREKLEGMLLDPRGDFTVSNAYSANQYAEIGLAAGTEPLKQPTEHVSPKDLDAVKAIQAENDARRIALDDGSSTNYMGNATNKALPLPYLTKADGTVEGNVRVGSQVTFKQPVVLDWRNSAWKFQPTRPVTTNGADVVEFSDTRAENLMPRNVGGDLKIASFNVLNYFATTGEAYAASGAEQKPPVETHCTYYTDRSGERIGNNSCGVKQPGETYTSSNPNDGRGPRGAATAESLARQEAKLVNTINTLDADVIALEEIENSIKLPGATNRDAALAKLVRLLNEANPGTWAYVRSPGEAMTAAAIGEQDVIRSAFIYKKEFVEPVGQSDLLLGTDEFANAREPLAQAFKAKGAPDKDAFGVIGNHFKSKGDNSAPGAPAAVGDNAADDVTGVGAFNGDRIRAAARLVEFADEFAAERGIGPVFLAGDFNAYSKEEPIEVLAEGGFELIPSSEAGDHTYSYNGLSGSLDHVLGNAEARAMVTGSDVWQINANESAAFQYSRYNYNVTDFFQPELPFATSDHNPHVIGIDVPDFAPTSHKEVAVLATNDFHGRLLPEAGNAAGAAPFATAVDELRADNPNNVFVAAGDLVGASTFESFIQKDEPTIDALNAMGLEVSAAGNHEFDGGYEDLVGRIKDRAEWEYIAANVVEPEGRDELAETWTTVRDGVKIGFVGAVTEDLPALVNPDGIAGLQVTDVVEATNAAAADLKADGADVVVLLVHEGSSSTSCLSPTFTDGATAFGNIVQNTSGDVDAIVSGHTHLAYNCRYEVKEWADEDRDVTKRPVVSAGQYGTNLNELVFKFDTTNGELVGVDSEIVAAAGVGHAPRADVAEIVDAAVAHADVAGAEVLGVMDAEANRAVYSANGGTVENRGGESVLGNVVAEAQRWATDAAGIETDIAFMNPGGLRADMPGTAAGELRELTYRQAADVQPFANTLVNMDLTGAQIKTLLEQQWQRNALGGVPSRPFQRLGVSNGFVYTYSEVAERVAVPNAAPVDTFRGTVTGMWLNGVAIDEAKTYSVTANSFLGAGGDNFWEFANGQNVVDTGKVDLAAMVEFMAAHDAGNPLDVDRSQRGVQLQFPADAPAEYEAGDTVAFDIASWAMTAEGDVVDSEVVVKNGETVLGRFPLDNARASAPYDTAGKASVSFVLPDAHQGLTLVGEKTGTVVPLAVGTPIAPEPEPEPEPQPELVATRLAAKGVTAVYGQKIIVPVTVTPGATGRVELRRGTQALGSAPIVQGRATVTIPARVIRPGKTVLSAVYAGDKGHEAARASFAVTVTKAAARVKVTAPKKVKVRSGKATVRVTVTRPQGARATGTVVVKAPGQKARALKLKNGTVKLKLKSFARTGAKRVVVTYRGDSLTASKKVVKVVRAVR